MKLISDFFILKKKQVLWSAVFKGLHVLCRLCKLSFGFESMIVIVTDNFVDMCDTQQAISELNFLNQTSDFLSTLVYTNSRKEFKMFIFFDQYWLSWSTCRSAISAERYTSKGNNVPCSREVFVFEALYRVIIYIYWVMLMKVCSLIQIAVTKEKLHKI